MRAALRLVPVLLSAWIIWFGWASPASADGPNVPLTDTTPQQLVIPTIELDTPIETVGLGSIEIDGQTYPIWETSRNYVGWHQGSGPPGQPGNTVLAGHSNGGREIFRRLEELNLEDEIYLSTNSGWHRYRIVDKFIVREQGEPVEVRAANARWILPTEDERLTLVTCWPYPSSTHRLLVIAYPISPTAPSNRPTSSTTSLDPEPESKPEPRTRTGSESGLQPQPRHPSQPERLSQPEPTSPISSSPRIARLWQTAFASTTTSISNAPTSTNTLTMAYRLNDQKG